MDDRIFRQALEPAHEAVGILRDGITIYANPAYAALFGFASAEALIGRPAQDFAPPAPGDAPDPPPAPLRYLTRAARRDGTTFDLEVSASRFQHDGETYTLVLLRDATQLELLQGRFEDQHRLMGIAEQVSGIGYWFFDMEQLRSIFSPGLWRLFGQPPRETPISAEEFLPLLPEDERERVWAAIEAAATAETPMDIVHRVDLPDGQQRWIRAQGQPMTDPRTGRMHMYGTASDITALRRAEMEQARLQEQLGRIQRLESLGTLAAGVAHDFNNLLQAILGNVDLLGLELTGHPSSLATLGQIDYAAQRAAELTKHLLGFARGGKFDPRPLDPSDLALRQLELFTRTHKLVVVETDLAEGCPAVLADAGQIEMVLLNLLVNAAQAMPSGGTVRVRTRPERGAPRALAPELDAGSYVRFEVRDTGPGMTEEVRQRAFDPFFTTKERGRGTGLGLASAFGVVRNHGGAIQIDSAPGQGTTVTFWLPTADREARPSEPDLAPETTHHGLALLVDDEVLVLEATRRTLEHLGYQVLSATSAKGALDLLEHRPGPVDLVVLDVVMPGPPVAQTFAAIRQRAPEALILLASGFSLEETTQGLLRNPAVGFLPKPFSMRALAEKIRALRSLSPDRGRTG